MHRPGATVAEISKVARIKAPLDSHESHRLRHQGIGHDTHGPGRLQHRHAQRLGQVFFHGAICGLLVELELTAQKTVGVHVTQNYVAVGHGGALPPAAIACRPGIGARTLWADVHTPHAVNPGDRTSTGSDRVDVDGGRTHRIGVEQCLCANFRTGIANHRHIERGTPHVAEQQPLQTRLLAAAHPGTDPSRGAGLQQHNGFVGHRLRRGQAAVRLHEEELTLEPLLGQQALQTVDVATTHRPQHGVHHRGAAALVLLHFGIDLVRKGDEVRGQQSLEFIPHQHLVGRIGVGVQQANGHGLDIAVRHLAGHVLQGVEIGRLFDLATGKQTLVQFKAPATLHQRGRVVKLQVVQIGAVMTREPTQFQNVSKPSRGDERRLGGLVLHHHVGGHRGAMPDEADLSGCAAAQRQNAAVAIQGTHRAIGGGGGHLGGPDGPALFIDHHHIGEGAAYVNPDSSHALSHWRFKDLRPHDLETFPI